MIPRYAVSLCGLLALLLLWAGCDSGPGESIYNPDRTGDPDPVITTVAPDASQIVLAGIDEVIITGENFSPNPAENLVYFDDVRAEVLEASPTQLRVQAPNLPSPDLQIRVAVLGAENYSNPITYRLVAAAERFGELTINEEPTAVAADEEGNVFFYVRPNSNIDASLTGFQRISSEGERTQFASPAFAVWRNMAVGPDGGLYGVFGLGGVGLVREGMSESFPVFLSNQNEPLSALAFDDQGDLWLGSTAGNLFHVDLDTGTITEYVVDAEVANTSVRDLALYGGFLYLAITQQAGEMSPQVGSIVRFPVDGATLGAREEYAAISDRFAVNPLAIAFAEDGSMLVGTSLNEDNNAALLLVSPGGNAEQFYSGIVLSPVTKLAWGPGTSVYALGFIAGLEATEVRRDERLEDQAPPLPDLIRIESRREGA